jgi:hypothetical protein
MHNGSLHFLRSPHTGGVDKGMTKPGKADNLLFQTRLRD